MTPEQKEKIARQNYLNGLPDGVYINLSHGDYLDIDRVSNSFIKKLLMSPGDAWAGSAMNPDKKERVETPAYKLGRAYHTAMLEPELFDRQFCRDISKADEKYQTEGYPLLTNATEVGNKLAEFGLTKKKAGESAFEQATRLIQSGFTGFIWVLEQAEAEQELGDRTALAGEIFDDLIRDRERVHAIEEIRPFLLGGLSEVTILWTDEDGVRCKCRLDKLFADKIVDLKSFDNARQKPLKQCLLDQTRYNGYYIQASYYWGALQEITKQNLQLMDAEKGGELKAKKALDILDEIRARGYSLDFYLVFQQKSQVPNCVARRVRMFNHDIHDSSGVDPVEREKISIKKGFYSGLNLRAQLEVRKAKRTYQKYMEVYGPDQPWQYLEVVGDFVDDDFHDRWISAEDV